MDEAEVEEAAEADIQVAETEEEETAGEEEEEVDLEGRRGRTADNPETTTKAIKWIPNSRTTTTRRMLKINNRRLQWEFLLLET